LEIAGVIVRWFHLIAAFTWLGGLIFMNVVLTPAVGAKGIPPQFIRLMGMQRFSRYAWISVVTLVITGIIIAFAALRDVEAPLGTPYGIALLVKITLVFLMIAVTAFNSLVYGPKLVEGAPKPKEIPSADVTVLQRRIVILSYVNLALGFGILLMVAILNFASKT